MALVEINNYSITYDGSRSAVDNVSFNVEEGEIISIVGESGSGKSTILHGILGLLPRGAATKGSLKVFGKEIPTLSEAEQRAMRGRDMAIIFQDTGRYLNPIGRIGKQFWQYLRAKAKALGHLAVEMEAAGLYLTAMAAGKKALALFQISDHVFSGEALSAAERQDSFHEMMEVALRTAARADI